MRRRWNVEIGEKFAEEFAVFGEIDRTGIGTDDGQAEMLQRHGQIERRLSAELHDEAVGLFGVVDVEDFFLGERLEVEAVTGVVIGRDGFRIAVDHDGFDAELLRARRRRGSSSNRTQFPALCGWGRCRES